MGCDEVESLDWGHYHYYVYLIVAPGAR